MSGSQLSTNWICIATAGETVDKRVIEEQWLLDAAELYDPNLYTALLWPEHCKFYPNMGEVLELKAERDDEDVLRLYARICPNVSLMTANSAGQLLFSSPEFTLDGNFRGTGKTYLEGLGVTDNPAGISTTRLRFNRINKCFIGACKPLVFDEIKEFKQEKIMSDTKSKSSWRSFFNIKESPEDAPAETVPDDALKALADALATLEDRVSAIEGRLSEAEDNVTDVQEDVDTVKQIVDTEDFANLISRAPELAKSLDKLDKRITGLPDKQFKQNKKGFSFL